LASAVSGLRNWNSAAAEWSAPSSGVGTVPESNPKIGYFAVDEP
jgi:hypothetical protein